MNFPTAASGHLYQYVMTLGAFIMIVSSYSLAVVFESHDAKLQLGAAHLLNQQEQEQSRKFWQSYLEARKKDTEIVLTVLTLSTLFGAVLTAIGGYCWYHRVQKFEDQKRQLENEQLEHDTDSKVGRKKLQIA